MPRHGVDREPTIMILKSTDDPGTRVTEEEFFRILEGMIAK
jgi:hypothetical protein